MLKPSRALRFHATYLRQARPPPTHFTSTGPHAFSPTSPGPNAAAATVQSGGPKASIIDASGAPGAETARQRVERLRRTALQARMAELPWQERMIISSRRWLDLVHRGFTLILVGISATMVVVLVYALTDMIMFNRRRKAEYYEAKQKRNEEALRMSLKALQDGTANIKQKVLIKRYEAVKDAEEERINNRGAITKTLDRLFPGMLGRQSEARLIMKLDDDIVKALESGDLERLVEEEAIEAQSESQTSNSFHREGGRLDQKAQVLSVAAQSSTKSWTNWLVGR